MSSDPSNTASNPAVSESTSNVITSGHGCGGAWYAARGWTGWVLQCQIIYIPTSVIQRAFVRSRGS
jgi:hypothetical protein